MRSDHGRWVFLSFKKIDGSVFLCFFFWGFFRVFFPAGDISTKKWAVIRRKSGSLVAFYVSIGCDFFPVGFQTSLRVPPQMPPPPTEIRLYWGIINHHRWGGGLPLNSHDLWRQKANVVKAEVVFQKRWQMVPGTMGEWWWHDVAAQRGEELRNEGLPFPYFSGMSVLVEFRDNFPFFWVKEAAVRLYVLNCFESFG